MHSDNTNLLIESAHCYHDDPLAAAVRQATEVGVVVPSILRSELEDAGYQIVDDEQKHLQQGFKPLKQLTRVILEKDGKVAAMGASHSLPDALLHAVLGYLRERDMEHFGFIIPTDLHRLDDPSKLRRIESRPGSPMPDEVVAKVRTHIAGNLRRPEPK